MKFKSLTHSITEGGVKASMEDWLSDLPKAVISEIKKKYGKILAAANKPPYKTVFSADVKDGIGKILMANKVKPLMGSHKESVDAITMSFDTYHGDVNEEIELDEAGQAKLYRMRQSHGRAWRRGDIKKQTAMGNATYDKQTKEDERDVKRTGSIFNMRAKRMAGNRKLLGLSDSFEVQNGVELDEASDDTDIDMTQADFQKMIRSAYKKAYDLCKQGKDISKYKATITAQIESTEIREGILDDIIKNVKDMFKGGSSDGPRYVMTVREAKKMIAIATQRGCDEGKKASKKRNLRTESVELDEESNTIPDHARVVTQNLQKKTITFRWQNDNGKWIEQEVPQDEAPGFYTRAGTAMKARKTDKFGNLLKAPVTDVDAAKRAQEMEAVSARNIVTAKDLLNTIEKKKTGTKFELFGTKNGKEHTLKIRKSMLMAQVVYFTTGDREVLFQATASGLTVMDKKTRRPLLSGGNDMIWESADLTDVGHMMIEISEATEKPKILKRLIGQLKSKGMEVGAATAIATSTLQKSGTLKSGSHTLTKKGTKRQGMGAAGRAKDRAATESGKPTKSYAYNPQTNKATLRT